MILVPCSEDVEEMTHFNVYCTSPVDGTKKARDYDKVPGNRWEDMINAIQPIKEKSALILFDYPKEFQDKRKQDNLIYIKYAPESDDEDINKLRVAVASLGDAVEAQFK